jgi:hypothetical protein
MSAIEQLIAGLKDTIARGHSIADAESVIRGTLQALVLELANGLIALEQRIANLESSQPEVDNAGSGAAPEAPVAQPASDGAAQPPTAAGTAPTQSQA